MSQATMTGLGLESTFGVVRRASGGVVFAYGDPLIKTPVVFQMCQLLQSCGAGCCSEGGLEVREI